MRKTLFMLLACTFLSFTTSAQILFEQGYFIDNAGQRIECLIKNVGWKNNPTKIEYKLKEEAEPITLTVQDVKEFGISDLVKYQRFKVLIDRSSNSDNVNKLSITRGGEFKEELLLLKVIIEGKASLLAYEDKNLFRYFYNIDGKKTMQLVYKKYLEAESMRVMFNMDYRKQLYLDLNCGEQPPKDFGEVKYSKDDLKEIVIQYNDCKNVSSVNFDIKPKRNKFDFK